MATEIQQRTAQLLRRATSGDPAAADELLPLVYDELRRIARRLLADQPKAALQPTELIHEAYVRLLGGDNGAPTVEDRRHFRRLTTRAMRHVLVDQARARMADKRGGGQRPATLDEALASTGDRGEHVLAVHEALQALAALDPQLAEIVELRFFGGSTMEEIAELLGVSRRTVQRGWQLARAWWVEEYAEGDS